MRFYRITQARFNTPAQAFSGIGTTLAHGRWNHKRADLFGVYCADSLALSCLETLVHINTKPRVFPASVYFAVDVPDALIERPDPAALPDGWDAQVAGMASRDYGTEFLALHRAVCLAVPTVVQPMGTVALINVRHPDFSLAWASGPQPYEYDSRLE